MGASPCSYFWCVAVTENHLCLAPPPTGVTGSKSGSGAFTSDISSLSRSVSINVGGWDVLANTPFHAKRLQLSPLLLSPALPLSAFY